jgi:hypothetical protein
LFSFHRAADREKITGTGTAAELNHRRGIPADPVGHTGLSDFAQRVRDWIIVEARIAAMVRLPWTISMPDLRLQPSPAAP